MKTVILILSLGIGLTAGTAHAENKTINSLLQLYTTQGAVSADIDRGRQLWQKKFSDRSCAACHTQDLTASGKHIKTGKVIKPMAPSVTPERLTDSKKIEKWFRRNCKWTLGRECSVQEKADFLVYINQ